MLQLLLAPLVLHSGATGEFGGYCSGVWAWIFIACQVMLLLPFCFKGAGSVVGVVMVAGWIWLDLPSAALVVDGGL
jgi:hypothetical protein